MDNRPAQLFFEGLTETSQVVVSNESDETEGALSFSASVELALGEELEAKTPQVAKRREPATESTRDTQAPMMKNYLEMKQRYPEHILLYQVGDFFEVFYEDAQVVSDTLGIRLTSRDKNQVNPTPMCGVPIHALDNYLPKLLEEGLSCVVVVQVDEANGKGPVRREISRIVTPGVRYEGDGLDEKAYNFLGAIAISPRGTGAFAFMDVSTGHIRLEEVDTTDELIEAFQRVRPAELIIPTTLLGRKLERERWLKELKDNTKQFGCHAVRRPFEKAEKQVVLERVQKLLPPSSSLSAEEMESFQGLSPESLTALDTILNYVDEVSFGHVPRLASFHIEQRSSVVFIDAATRRNLELVTTRIDGERKHSLLQHIDYSVTPMGSREFRETILAPSNNLQEISERHEAVGAFFKSEETNTALRKLFAQVRDLDRLISRISSGRGTPRDLGMLRDSLAVLPQIKGLVSTVQAPLLARLMLSFDILDDVYDRLRSSLLEDLPSKLNEGGIFAAGFNEELDKLQNIRLNGKEYLQKLEDRERERTGIPGLKIKYNNVFGYFIEVSKAHAKKAPSDYDRKQTLVNAERFITPELKQFEQAILSAKAKQLDLEKQMFVELRQWVATHVGRIQHVSALISSIDVLQAFAHLAREHNYCCPEMVEEPITVIHDGRHSVVEQVIGAHNFVANDTSLNCEARRFAVLTGPNMGGKSTYLRQVGLIQLLAQAGSFVPAQSAKLGLVDRIFTRIGSSDDISRGDSTFMVEMREASTIVKKATPRSLVLIDEIGRGTATTDGLAIATSIAEWLHDRVSCRTLFATHFHELTTLAQLKSGAFCLAVGVVERGKEIGFTHRIEEGAADRSYGIEVARLAGLPEQLLRRAEYFLRSPLVENGDGQVREPIEFSEISNQVNEQYDLIRERLNSVHPDQMKPIEALLELAELKNLIEQ